MERMYWALARLAVVALVAGVVTAFTFQVVVIQQAVVTQQPSFGSVFPFQGSPLASPGYLLNELTIIFNNAVSVLETGAGMVALLIAWVDRRWRWSLVLALSFAPQILWFIVGQWALPVFINHPIVMDYLFGQDQFYILALWRLLPVLAGLAFVRLRNGRAAMRMEADADMELSRSQL